MSEEILKAKLILADLAWRDRIDAAEAHGYFSGQIEFLLDFSGITALAKQMPVKKWQEADHAGFLTAFDQYLKKAQIMFNSSGLAPTKPSAESNLWKRALLTVGDYLSSIGSNYSFHTDAPGNGDSWKRFLRGSGGGGKRELLKSLWDLLDEGLEIEPQLSQVIANASDLEAWRDSVVKHPEVISYCGQQEIRSLDDSDEIYLLKKRQMNGAHAELFSYALHLDLVPLFTSGRFAPLQLRQYREIAGTENEPYVQLYYDGTISKVTFAVESIAGTFRIYLKWPTSEDLTVLSPTLTSCAGFTVANNSLEVITKRYAIFDTLDQLASSLLKLEKNSL